MTATPATAAGIVDAHQHLWDPGVRDYPWMARLGLEPLRARFDLADLRRVTAAAGVDRTVLVQAVGSEAETRELLALADASDGLIAGVVGWVELRRADVADRIEQLHASAGGQLLVGVRHQVEDEPDPDWLRRRDVLAGLRAVAAADLAVDLLVRPDQLPAATAAVDAVDAGRFVLDHGAKPPVGQAGWAFWRHAVTRLAERPNVICKLSGLFTLGRGSDPRVDVAASAAHLMQCFGAERLSFGSDWPVCTLAAPYPEILTRTARLLTGCSQRELAAVFAGTASSAYRLADGPHACALSIRSGELR